MVLPLTTSKADKACALTIILYDLKRQFCDSNYVEITINCNTVCQNTVTDLMHASKGILNLPTSSLHL